jgi:succinate dehydrogenase / fumarate reductase, iron-sulfur subunit
MLLRLRIRRYNSETDQESYWAEYVVEVEPSSRVLDALLEVQGQHDPSLGFRASCGHGVCGSDAMIINGHSTLACKTLIRDAIDDLDDEPPTITIEPLGHMPVLRDLIVDQQPFFQRYRAIKPFLAPRDAAPVQERLQTPKEHAEIADATNCILCGACVSACPILSENPRFLGPAAIVQAARFVFDSRDVGLQARREPLDEDDGVWPCANHMACTRACPREIKVTRLINLTKRELRRAGDEEED